MNDLRQAVRDFEAHIRKANGGRDELSPQIKAKAKEDAAGTHLMVNARDEEQLWAGIRSTLMGLKETAKALGDQEMVQVLHKTYITVWKAR